jgi:hypothetical protein
MSASEQADGEGPHLRLGYLYSAPLICEDKSNRRAEVGSLDSRSEVRLIIEKLKQCNR